MLSAKILVPLLSAILLFSTVSAVNGLTILTGGDFNCKAGKGKTTMEAIAKLDLPFLGLGDYGYDKVACWIQLATGIKADKNLLNCVIGNHDKAELIALVAFCNNNRSDGAFYQKIDDVALIGINANTNWKKGSGQYNFIEESLNDAHKDPSIKYTAVNIHQLFKTFKVGGGHTAEKGMLSLYEPLFIKFGVDIVNQAHNHVQAILLPVLNDEDKGNDIPYTICGTGGELGDKISRGDVKSWKAASVDKGFCMEDFINGKIIIHMMNQKGQERNCSTPIISQCRFTINVNDTIPVPIPKVTQKIIETENGTALFINQTGFPYVTMENAEGNASIPVWTNVTK